MSSFWEQKYILSIIVSDNKIDFYELNSFYQRVESKVKKFKIVSLDGKTLYECKKYEDLEQYLWENHLCY